MSKSNNGSSKKRKFLWALVSCMLLMNISVVAQAAELTIKLQNVSMETVMNEIEKQTNYLFISSKDVDTDRLVSVNAKDKSVDEILNQMLKGTNVAYDINNSSIMLSKQQQPAEGKNVTVSGNVADDKGNPIPGATISVQGTTIGTLTDVDGKFSLNIPAPAAEKVIAVSFVGFETQNITVGNKTRFNVMLSASDILIDDVVVTALGIKRESKALGYNVQKVEADEITGVKDANFMNSLTGKVAGLQVNSSAGGVGGATKVVMRGAKSISKDNNVLYVIDGVPMYNANSGQATSMYTRSGTEGISDINPEDIESMSVLTGPSAAALYGSNAANGAILITTKKGQEGKAKITLSHSTDFSTPFVTPRFQNTYGNVAGEMVSWGEKLSTPSTFDPIDFFRTGVNTSTNVSLSMGSKTNQTFISMGVNNATGIMPNNDLDRYNFSFRNTASFFDNKLTAELGANYVRQFTQNPGTQGKYFNPLMALYLFPRGEDFSAMQLYERYDESRNIMTQYLGPISKDDDMQNPYWVVNRNLFLNNKDRYMLNASLKWDIAEGIDVVGRVRMDNEYSIVESKRYAGTSGKYAQKYGYYSNQKVQNKQTYADVIANLNKRFADFDLTANVGASISDMQYDSQGFRGQLKQIPNFFSANNVDLTATNSGVTHTRWREQTQAVFASAELGYKSMLYLSATARNDWASQLANTSQASFFYPSVGLSGIITEMVNMPEFFTFMKVRGSYSQVGSAISRNISIPTYAYDAGVLQTITRYPVEELYPEMTTSYEGGLTMRLLDNHIDLDVTYYKSNTRDQTFNAPISSSTGYSTIIVQTGNVQNQGIEAALGFNAKIGGNLKWNSRLTYNMNKNEIISLVDGFPDPITGEPIEMSELNYSQTGTYLMKLTKGGSIGDIYTTNRFYTDNQGDIYVNDAAQLGSPVNETYKIGNANPKFNMGFSNSFSYKGVDLSFLITARVGGEVVSATEAALDNYGVSERSAIARDNGGVQVNNGMLNAQYYYQYIGAGDAGMASMYTYSATNVRLQELSLGYNLPKHWFNNKLNIKAAVTGRNLWMIYNKAPFDPEVASSTSTYYQGFDYFMLPSTRNIGFSLRIEY
ncbi:MAG: SusC/RagA family TonB-linked outer membrane protein [Mangrovibacterium sp.]